MRSVGREDRFAFRIKGLKAVLKRSHRGGKEKDREARAIVRAFSGGCTLVKVPTFTANDPVFVFIAPMQHLSRYFRLTPALNGSINILSAIYTCVYVYVKADGLSSAFKRVPICNHALCAYMLYHCIVLTKIFS